MEHTLITQQKEELASLESRLKVAQAAYDISQKKLQRRIYVLSNIERTKKYSDLELRMSNLPKNLLIDNWSQRDMSDAEYEQSISHMFGVRLYTIELELQKKIQELHEYEFNEWEKTYDRDRPLGYGATTWKIKQGHRPDEYSHGIREQIDDWIKQFRSRQMKEETYNYITQTPTEQIYADVKAKSELTDEVLKYYSGS